MCSTTHYIGLNNLPMIISFRHKGLEELFEEGESIKLPQDRIRKLIMFLQLIDAARDLRDVNRPGLRLHKLKGHLSGFHSIDVTGNYRLIFRFENGNASDVDYLDTH